MTLDLAIPERIEAPDDQRVARWRAFSIALALHATLVLAAVSFVTSVELADVDGAQAIEVDMIAAAPEAQPTDAPVGPEANDSAAAPDSAQRDVRRDMARAEEAPVGTADAERIVQPEKKEERPVEKEAAQAPAPASVASLASEASAPAAIENSVAADISRAPTVGAGEAAVKAKLRWQRQLVAHLDRHKRYPAGTRMEGEIPVRFTIDRAGRILSAHLLKSSGSPALDEAAVAMVRRSDPVPPPPEAIGDQALTMTVPVVFRARSR
ncbi:MAG: energy transducer TonB [Beijerinckiaceae bacterium]